MRERSKYPVHIDMTKKDSRICGGSKLTKEKRVRDEALLMKFFERPYADTIVARIMETSAKQVEFIPSMAQDCRHCMPNGSQKAWTYPKFYQVTNSIAKQDTCPWRYFKDRVFTTQLGRKGRAPCYYLNERETYAAPETHRTSTVMRRHCGLLWSLT